MRRVTGNAALRDNRTDDKLIMLETRSCKHCLLRDDPNQTDMHRVVTEYIDSMSADSRADMDTVNARLEICASCAYLMSGVCSLCGCFVEVRAAKRLTSCPAVPSLWEMINQEELLVLCVEGVNVGVKRPPAFFARAVRNPIEYCRITHNIQMKQLSYQPLKADTLDQIFLKKEEDSHNRHQ